MTRKTEIAAARKADTEIAAAWSEFWTFQDQYTAKLKEIESAKKVRARVGALRIASADERIARLEAEAELIREDANSARNDAVALDKKLYKGWSRFFLVGHLHRSAHCSSFRVTTRVTWLPEVSGLTEAEAVAAHGETLCTICFPSAPTELTNKKVDEEICTGNTDWTAPKRQGFYTGNWGTCTDCGQKVTMTSAGNLRKHKK